MRSPVGYISTSCLWFLESDSSCGIDHFHRIHTNWIPVVSKFLNPIGFQSIKRTDKLLLSISHIEIRWKHSVQPVLFDGRRERERLAHSYGTTSDVFSMRIIEFKSRILAYWDLNGMKDKNNSARTERYLSHDRTKALTNLRIVRTMDSQRMSMRFLDHWGFMFHLRRSRIRWK
jgi:hypothetical protein